MKKMVLIALIAFTGLASAHSYQIEDDWGKIEFRKPRKITNEKVIDSVDKAIADAVYSEDEGYEFKKLQPVENVLMTVLYKEAHDPIAMEVTASASVGGFGWFPGYRTGTAFCTVTVFEGHSYDWSWDGDNAIAECEIEYDDVD